MNRVNLSKNEAEIILRQWLGKPVHCTALRPLTGGCVNTVVEVHFDHPSSPVVFKVAQGSGFGKGEYNILDFYRKNTHFPVPEPYFYDASATELPYSYLIMERVPGENMGDASSWMDSSDRLRVERQIAQAVAELHTHTRERFGSFREEGTEQPWGEQFQRSVQSEYRRAQATSLLSPETQKRIGRLIEKIPQILDAPAKPTLVHGDIWATNIMIDRTRQGASLSGFLDARGLYAHPEFELAYLQIWHTVGPAFFEVYTQTHPLLEGYEVRRLIYWLNTLLIHVHYFKDQYYVLATETLTTQLSRIFL